MPLLQRTEIYIHAHVQTTQAPIKVALVDDETAYERDISDELTGTATPLFFNGQLAGAQLDSGCGPALDEPCFLPLRIPSTGKPSDYTTAVDTLNDFQPDVIVSITGAAFVSRVLDPLETVWDELRLARPFYLMGPYSAGLPELADAVVSSTQQNEQCNGSPCPKLTSRLIGINYESARNPAVVTSYRTRIHTQYPQAPDFYSNFENFYDAAWYLFYAIAAAGDVPLTGSEIARGMGRLIKPATAQNTFAVGPNDVSSSAPRRTDHAPLAQRPARARRGTGWGRKGPATHLRPGRIRVHG